MAFGETLIKINLVTVVTAPTSTTVLLPQHRSLPLDIWRQEPKV